MHSVTDNWRESNSPWKWEPTRDDVIAATEPTRADVDMALRGEVEIDHGAEPLEVIGVLDVLEPPAPLAKAKPRPRARRIA